MPTLLVLAEFGCFVPPISRAFLPSLRRHTYTQFQDLLSTLRLCDCAVQMRRPLQRLLRARTIGLLTDVVDCFAQETLADVATAAAAQSITAGRQRPTNRLEIKVQQLGNSSLCCCGLLK